LASITHESSRELKLEIGTKVFALIKASFIKLEKYNESKKESEKNIFTGQAYQTVPGLNNTEVILSVSDDFNLVCTLPNITATELIANRTDKISAYIDPTNIIIGIAA
jgi:molybdate transport system regulatory protein